jgi:hypothetical protein
MFAPPQGTLHSNQNFRCNTFPQHNADDLRMRKGMQGGVSMYVNYTGFSRCRGSGGTSSKTLKVDA